MGLVRYDDRLRTVLAQPATSPHDRAVRWRQLVELLARGGEASDRALFAQSIAAVRAEAPLVDEAVRAAAARALAALPVPLELVSAFAADRLSVAAPVLASARLTASEWAEVADEATGECRRFILSLRSSSGSAGEPTGAAAGPPQASVRDDAPANDGAIPSISEVVARIERVRQSREHPDETLGEPSPGAPPEPPEPPRLFHWECTEGGEIAWVEGAPRGALIGRSIARTDSSAEVDGRVERAFKQRMPFRDATLELAEGSPVAGSWKISGVPAFDPASGRFAGYRGIAERKEDSLGEGCSFPVQDPDLLRELAHEIKTPLNAIIGFAEIISGQYFGPAADHYRDRAREIVTQAHLLLTAIDDLDFAAKLQSRRGGTASADLRSIAGRVAAQLGEEGLAVEFDVAGSPACALDPELAERLLSRFCRSVAAASQDRPTRFAITSSTSHCVVRADRPATVDDAKPELGMRLVLGLARIAGGDIDSKGERIKLLLPKA